jgi:hypothetical protein
VETKLIVVQINDYKLIPSMCVKLKSGTGTSPLEISPQIPSSGSHSNTTIASNLPKYLRQFITSASRIMARCTGFNQPAAEEGEGTVYKEVGGCKG